MFKIRFALLAVAALLTGCATGPDIRSDYDRSVDFSQYRTYNFFSPMGIENPNYSSLLGQMFRDAIDAQMQPRGYVLSDNPDLLINVSAQFQDKTKVRTYTEPTYGVGYYGYRRGYYGEYLFDFRNSVNDRLGDIDSVTFGVFDQTDQDDIVVTEFFYIIEIRCPLTNFLTGINDTPEVG